MSRPELPGQFVRPPLLAGCSNDEHDDEAPSLSERRIDALRGLQRILEDLPPGCSVDAQALAAILAVTCA